MKELNLKIGESFAVIITEGKIKNSYYPEENIANYIELECRGSVYNVESFETVGCMAVATKENQIVYRAIKDNASVKVYTQGNLDSQYIIMAADAEQEHPYFTDKSWNNPMLEEEK